MRIRYAKNADFNFLVEGLEKTRQIEKRPAEQIPAKQRDKKQLREAIRKKNIRVVEAAGEAVGFLYFRTDFRVMLVPSPLFWIDLIYVKETWRRKGLGRLLYEDAIRIAKKKGFDKIVIDIFEANRRSKLFHKQLGFEPVYTIYQKRIAPSARPSQPAKLDNGAVDGTGSV